MATRYHMDTCWKGLNIKPCHRSTGGAVGHVQNHSLTPSGRSQQMVSVCHLLHLLWILLLLCLLETVTRENDATSCSGHTFVTPKSALYSSDSINIKVKVSLE